MRLTLFLLKYEGELNWPPRKTALKNPSLIIVRIKKLSSPTQVFVEDESVTFLINSKLIHQWPTLQQQKALSVYYQMFTQKLFQKLSFAIKCMPSTKCQLSNQSINRQIKSFLEFYYKIQMQKAEKRNQYTCLTNMMKLFIYLTYIKILKY